MIRSLLLVGAAVVTMAAADPRDTPELGKALAGKIAGPAKDCLSPHEARQSATYDGVVLFRVSSKLTYRNDMSGCPVLRRDDILKTRLYGSTRLCRGDIAEIISRGGYFTKGGCPFGDFVAYRTAG